MLTDRNKPGDHLMSADSLVDHVFIKRDLTVVLLVDIQILHQALVQKIFKGPGIKTGCFLNYETLFAHVCS